LTVAGRTDAGVHARGQVAHVDVPATTDALQRVLAPQPPTDEHHGRPTPAEGLVRRLNGVLPPDVRVKRLGLAPEGFDARFSALSRRYSYRVADGWVEPTRRHDTLAHPWKLDVTLMAAASTALLGEHDFAAFCRRREGATTVRALLDLNWYRDEDGVVIARVKADAFCHSMVRALVGSLLAVGDRRRPGDWPATVLASGTRHSGLTVAPAHGLTMEEVRYPSDADLARRAQETRRLRARPAS
jgi:tRNA pseudouridine38-40 synthase